MRWQSLLRAIDVAHVAAVLGLDVKGRSCGPCPCCGSDRRGDQDRRHPIVLRADGMGWSCYSCGASGDAAALVAARVVGATKRLTADQWGACREAVESLGLIEGERGAVALRPLPESARAKGPTREPPPWDVPPDVARYLGGGTDLVAEVLALAYLAECGGLDGTTALDGAIDYVGERHGADRYDLVWGVHDRRRELASVVAS